STLFFALGTPFEISTAAKLSTPSSIVKTLNCVGKIPKRGRILSVGKSKILAPNVPPKTVKNELKEFLIV
ncbi:MAG: hypothetical protein EBY37_00700, partial [Flavobacteriia bacterium]|nr:hypothetical protein [Flavobacteriia bacterium]